MTGEEIKQRLQEKGITPATFRQGNQKRVLLRYDPNEHTDEAIKSMNGRQWSNTLNGWHIAADKKLLEQLIVLLQADDKKRAAQHTPHLVDFLRQLKLSGYSPNTIQCYKNNFLIFASYFAGGQLAALTRVQIEEFLEHSQQARQYSASAMNVMVNAIKFFYEKVLKHPRTVYQLPRVKKPAQLPAVFGESEVRKILEAAGNLKHRSMLCLAYAGGLRVSEVVQLKLADIDSSRMVINIKEAKGKKDRQVMLSEKLLILLREYFKEYKPVTWLFEGQRGEQYSKRSVQLVVSHAKQKAGVRKKGSVHALRHSFATHLMEGGTDIMSIKELLGHTSIRTTSRYTHVSKKHISKIQSPLDKLL